APSNVSRNVPGAAVIEVAEDDGATEACSAPPRWTCAIGTPPVSTEATARSEGRAACARLATIRASGTTTRSTRGLANLIHRSERRRPPRDTPSRDLVRSNSGDPSLADPDP